MFAPNPGANERSFFVRSCRKQKPSVLMITKGPLPLMNFSETETKINKTKNKRVKHENINYSIILTHST
jgi:hypothetical protein